MARVKNRATGREREVLPERSLAGFLLIAKRIHDRSHDRVISTSYGFHKSSGIKPSRRLAKECRRAEVDFSVPFRSSVRSRWNCTANRNRYLIMKQTCFFRAYLKSWWVVSFWTKPLSSSRNCSWCCFEEVVSYYCCEEYAGFFSLDISRFLRNFCPTVRTGCSIFEKIETRDSFFFFLVLEIEWVWVGLFVEYDVIDIWCNAVKSSFKFINWRSFYVLSIYLYYYWF